MEKEIKSVEDIIKLPDVKSARNLMKRWGLDTKGYTNKDEYIKKLVDYWNERGGDCKTQVQDEDTGAGLQDAIAVDKKNRIQLKEKYDQILKFYKELPTQYQSSLNEAFPNLPKLLEQKKIDLDSRECTILVAGETGAGKSTFINLLLEIDLLPTSQLSCSQTICEIRKSKDGKKNAYCYFRSNGKKRAPEILDLSNGKNIEQLRQRIVCVDSDTDDSPYERIEIYMPFPMLEDGVVIVDSPGIGESRQRTRFVEKYLSKSFGTIYLVNMAAAGGVNKGRLRDFLRTVVNSGDDEPNPSASIFIGNKLDSVDKRDVEEVQKITSFKLKQCYTGLKDENIFFMSTKEALKGIEYGTRLPEHKHVLRNGIQRLFPASMRNNLLGHYRFQSQVLKRAIYTLKVARMMAATGMESKHEEIEEIRRRMDILERNSRRTIEDLRKGIAFEENNLYQQIADTLRSRDFTDRVFNISPGMCAAIKTKEWKVVARDASFIIANNITEEIDAWDQKATLVDTIREKIIKKFQNECEMYEAQITEIEGALMDGDCRAITDLHKSMKKQAPVKQLWQKANKAPSGKQEGDKFNSLGGVVSSAGGLDTNDKRVKDICRSFKGDDKVSKMHKLTAFYIESIFGGNDLKLKLSKFISKFLKGIDTIAKKIPEFLSADRRLITALKDDISNAETNLREVFPKYLPRGALLQGDLDIFYVKKIMEMDYRLRDLHFNPKEDLLGTGSFAEVYKATMDIRGNQEVVALKVSKEPLRENTVSDILLEDRTMRDLDHPNIVQYFGSTIREDPGRGKHRLHWIMVIELCTETLKERIINADYRNPAKCKKYSEQVDQMEAMANIAIQLCRGLDYLHKKDLVHRDLKLENILIAKGPRNEDLIKLTDVGLTKPQRDIAGSSVGSPAYMAPEVLLQTEIYNRKADIYALAIILWELWYGIDAAEHIQQQLFSTLEKAVKGGLRPSMSLEQKPPEDWIAIIKQCWQIEPSKRPEAQTVLDFFSKFKDGQ